MRFRRGPEHLGETPVEIIARDVETAFRAATETSACREFWRLWEISTDESPFRYPQHHFAALMEKENARPATDRRIEHLGISVTSPQAAVAYARIGVEDPNPNASRSVVRPFLFSYESGWWRPQLSDFLGLASSASPWQPPSEPPSLSQPAIPSPCSGRPGRRPCHRYPQHRG